MKKKKSSMQTTSWFDPVYRQNFWFVGGCSHNEAEKWARQHLALSNIFTKETRTCAAITVPLVKDEGLASGVFIFCEYIEITDAAFHADIAHECCHAAEMTLGGKAGMEMCSTNDEAYAYYIGYLVRTILESIQYNRKTAKFN